MQVRYLQHRCQLSHAPDSLLGEGVGGGLFALPLPQMPSQEQERLCFVKPTVVLRNSFDSIPPSKNDLVGRVERYIRSPD